MRCIQLLGVWGKPPAAGGKSRRVYYYRTYEKAVSGGGEREKGGHVLMDTASRGLYVRVWPPHSGAGEGEVVSKEVGEEERGAQG